MTKNKVMTLWTIVISAFIALFSALGLVSPAAAAAPVQQTEEAHRTIEADVPDATTSYPFWAFKRSLPPTMKQRIRAEAHGSSPSCRHRPPADSEQSDSDTDLANEALAGQL
ncbi:MULTISPECIES: DUF6344 domain-containing protein [unclassified Streptomyces]|uniref:DUF6344 domain-containing protein n=1 Tax=unclassified Streptomyces TaxID=2593676 RepID=UPI000DB9C2A1|nr:MULTISPECIES: DUF6344 domain-containing protein [unclassified Streptomyces]MYT70166.1 hypothetical protein [Streptomyces sp. SID8367]RAJ88742.1 hypothetical protein K377_02200 [Streptomyces sp. PsTaAH-137]